MRRAVAAAAVAALSALLAGCGDEAVAPDDGNGGGGPPPAGPFTVIQVYLRPLAIERPPLAGGRPTPSLAEHAVSAFYTGGTELATFEWSIPPAIGVVQPKTVHLGRADATVVIRGDGNPPLGFFEIEARGRSGQETSALTQRFAVIENRWMKHVRNIFTGNEPEDLAQWPTFMTAPGRPANGDSIVYVYDNNSTRKILGFPAFVNLNGPEPCARRLLAPPDYPESANQAQNAPQTQPDFAPAGLGRNEMLFSSRIDPQYPIRCPREPCENTPPFRLWVVRRPASSTDEPFARVLTADTTYVGAGGQDRWIAYQYMMPKWDPKSTGNIARIAFLSDRSDDPLAARIMRLWYGDLVDSNGDARSDSLVNLRLGLAGSGSIASFVWHPDGTRICFVDGAGLGWLDAGSGTVSRIVLPDPELERVTTPTVFWRAGEHTLVAVQAQSENLRNLYVWDEQDNTLTTVLPYPVPVTHNLYPAWHPTRKALVYISDNTVRAWSNTSAGPGPAGCNPPASAPDRIDPTLDPYYSISRTTFPSPWVLSFE